MQMSSNKNTRVKAVLDNELKNNSFELRGSPRSPKKRGVGVAVHPPAVLDNENIVAPFLARLELFPYGQAHF